MLRIVLLIMLLLFSGCEETKKIEKKVDALQEKKMELDKKIAVARAEADKEKELALLKMRKKLEELSLKESKTKAQKELELAKIKAQKELDLQKIEKELKLKEIELKREKTKIELENQKLLAQKELEVKKIFLIYALIAFVLLLFFAGIVLYIYKKRKDKLIAYHDNLEKYFRLKENETKVQIANKIIDTIASGKLTPDQEQRLITVLQSPNNIDKKELPKEIGESIDVEIDENKKE